MTETEKKSVHSSFWSNIFNPPAEKVDLEKSLQSIPLFASLGKKDLANLINIIHNRNYLAGEYIFYQGDPGIGLYIIREGQVDIERSNEDGQKVKLATFNKALKVALFIGYRLKVARCARERPREDYPVVRRAVEVQ